MKFTNIICECHTPDLSLKAANRLKDEGFDVSLAQYGTADVDANEKRFIELCEDVKDSKLVIVRVHAGLTYFKKFDRLKEVIVNYGIPLFIESEMPDDVAEHRHLFTGSQEDYRAISSYIQHGGDENEYGLFSWLLYDDGVEIEVPEPKLKEAQGFYLPGKGLVDSIEVDNSKPVVAVLFNQSNYLSGDLKHIDAIINRIYETGSEAYPIFLNSNPNEITGSIGIGGVVDQFLMKDGKSIVDSVILTLPFSQMCLSDPGDGTAKVIVNVFEKLGVPVIHGVTMFSSQPEWEANASGLTPYELSMNIFWPEYDGQIISVPFASTEYDESWNATSLPIEDRVNALVTLANNWSKLKRTPIKERKIAVLLHQNPPRADMIGGAFGLDAQESTVNLLRKMKIKGYQMDFLPTSGQDLTRKILDGVSNNTDWLSEEDMRDRAAAMVSGFQYRSWLDSIPQNCKKDMEKDWGSAPGELYAIDGKIIIPGIIDGNVFIGLQPNRCLTEDSVDLYHSQDLTPPHSYLAFYRWLTEEFGAHAVIHMGCHGTLEWLPGKGTGLSSSCYPDVVFGHIPHIYPYAMSNPGEGMHAKRRNGAVIVDHLIPPMSRAGSYDELLDVELQLQDYLRAKSAGSSEKMLSIAQNLMIDCEKLALFSDIGLEKDCSVSDFQEKIEVLYDYICDVKDNLIKSGLHILGKPPEEEGLDYMVYALTRMGTESLPPLRNAIAEIRGYEIEDLISNSSETDEKSGMLKGQVADQIDDECFSLICKLREFRYDLQSSLNYAKETFGDSEKIEGVVEAICNDYVPKLFETTEELTSILNVLDGKYLLPGPSGCITRGNPHLLPSGRNFYSIDPASIPTRSAWNTGETMAKQMIQRHIDETGAYPKQVGIVIWATDTMKTGGDDIAYVLHLLGVKPVWSSVGGSVVGLEIIPVSELKRPRIDVTLRISGLFRDSFPNLVDYLDEAIEKISKLDESDEDNYLLAHLRKDLADSIAEGMDPIVAERRARVRIFGDPPGNYGGGVDSLIESSQWGDKSELAEAYVEWGGYGYGKGLKGEDMKDFFRKRMAEVDVTVKNHESRELDAFDNDDDYVFLGGMNATVEVCKGEKPMSVMGDSSNPASPKLRTLEEESKFIYRSRVLNPKWIEGLKKHGYRGVQEVTNLVEFSFGWDSTSDVMEDWMYQSVTDKFLFNEDNKKWIEENNPDALRQISARLLEAVERGMWDADSETVEELKSIFMNAECALEKINDH